eukprot:10057518-Alexandrium_andersonii.AAC.1
MSASLVGSEMCIRDSARSARFARSLASWPCSIWRSCRTTTSTSRCWKWPVSYTHLTLPTICSV